MKSKVEGHIEGRIALGTPLEKRFKIPGIVITSYCPVCGNNEEVTDQIDYAKVRVPSSVSFECNECGSNWEIMIIVDVTVKIAE